MSIKLASQLPKGTDNGLGPIVRDLARRPDQFKVVLAIVDCKQVTTDTDTCDVIPTMRIRRVEAITAPIDLATARVLMEHAIEQRTGRMTLPLDFQDELAAAFETAATEA